ncbi:MAG: hypothetical protein OHK0053_18330 [Microscillaceae bacterium]
MEENNSVNTTRVGLRFGLYAGIALVIYSSLITVLHLQNNFFIATLSYVILGSAMVFGMTDYKRYNEDAMTYGQGLGLGLLVAVVAGIVDATFQAFYVYFNPQIVAETRKQAIAEYEKQGFTAEQLDLISPWLDVILTPGGIFMVLMVGYFLVGLILSLITAAFQYRNPPLFD